MSRTTIRNDSPALGTQHRKASLGLPVGSALPHRPPCPSLASLGGRGAPWRLPGSAGDRLAACGMWGVP